MALTKITEKGIKDGEILNADINASAAIAGSKISPDFGTQDLVTTGNVDLSDSSGVGNNRIKLGTGDDLEIYHDGTNSRFHNSTGLISMKASGYRFNDTLGIENCLDIDANGAVKLYHDNSVKLETTSYGVLSAGMGQFDDGLKLTDSRMARFGTSNDLTIYHDSTDSFIDNNTGALRLCSDTHYIKDKDNSDLFIKCIADGAVSLYYDDNLKFETLSDGAKVTGKLLTIGDTGITIEATSTNTAGQLTIIGVNNSDQISAITRIKSVSTDSSSAATATTFSNRNSSNAVNEHMRIDSSGRLLVGQTGSDQSTSMLQVKRANNSIIRVASSDATATNFAAIDFAPANSIAGARIKAVAAGTFSSTSTETAYLAFDTRNEGTTAEAMRITQSGKIGIGTASPSTQLHVNGGDGLLVERSSGTSIAGFKHSGASAMNIYFQNTGSTNHPYIGSSNQDLTIGTNNTERLRVLSAGGLTFNGDTAAANALDDYEEGEVTITTTASNGNAITVDSSYNKLTYTKIGNVVHVWGYVYFSANSNADGFVQINSLPFTVKDAHGASGHARAVNTAYFNRELAYLPDGAGTYNVQVYANEGNTWLRVYDLNGSGRRVDTCAKFLGAGSVININFSYLAA